MTLRESHVGRFLRTLFGHHVLQDFHHLLAGRCPGHRRSVHFFEWMNDVFAVQRNVRLPQGCTESRIKSGVPLLVLITKADHREIALLNVGPRSDRIYLCRLMIAPKWLNLLPQHITCGITGLMIRHRGSKSDGQACRL